ncbi:MAG TPA: hypothetical protein VGQ45_10775 [Gaiellales bacterium]|jgi:hypothetical protein|nr:hypothetical protein [Gaiellales bacterium]
MTIRTGIWATISCVAALSAGCGSAAAGSSGHSAAGKHVHKQQATGTESTTDDQLQPAAVASSQDMVDYLRALTPMRREVALANAAAHKGAQLASSDPAAAGRLSAQVSHHLARASRLAGRVTPPAQLEHAHASLVRAYAIGSRMTMRLSVLLQHLGPSSRRDYKQRVLPLEKHSLRLGNSWYGPTARMLKDLHVRRPGWMGGLFDWS